LLPCRDELLNRPGGWQPLLLPTAFPVRLVIESLDMWAAQHRQMVLDRFQILLRQNLLPPNFGTPGHHGRFYHVRLLFAYGVK
jgi:hypothetical protein